LKRKDRKKIGSAGKKGGYEKGKDTIFFWGISFFLKSIGKDQVLKKRKERAL